jgi:adenylylsulfate kinase
MKKIYYKKKKQGYLIWLTGISGSGKSSIAKKIIKSLRKNIGSTILINGDDIREIFKLNSYDNLSRKEIAFMYSKFCNFINRQGINILFATISMFEDVRKLNRKLNPKTYIEIFIKCSLEKSINNKKNIYRNKKNIVGKDIKLEEPKLPDIKIINNLDRSINEISSEILDKILKIIK